MEDGAYEGKPEEDGEGEVSLVNVIWIGVDARTIGVGCGIGIWNGASVRGIGVGDDVGDVLCVGVAIEVGVVIVVKVR